MSGPSAPGEAEVLDTETLDPALAAYYRDRRLMLRNIVFIIIGNLGHNIGLGISTTLSILHMKANGVPDIVIATMAAVNFWLVSYLVMYFSWRSDHTVTRWGRRIPYTFLSMWFIVVTVALFPFFAAPISLILLYSVKYLFLDMKGSTWGLITIDCMPRHLLGRMSAINTIASGIVGFVVTRYGMRLAESHEQMVFLVSAGIILVCTVAAMLGVKEPPVRNPTAEPFRPWSALKIGLKDRRILLLILGVAMINGCLLMWSSWSALWATNRDGFGLGLTKGELGEALSWGSLVGILVAIPTGYLIDKVSGIRLVVVYWFLQLATLGVILTQVRSASGMLIVGLMTSAYGGLYTAADMMVWRRAHPRDMGSVTASNSFVRNMYHGCLTFIGGVVVAWHGKDSPDYLAALVLGMGMATLGLSLFFLHRWAMRPRNGTGTPSPLTAPAVAEA